MITAIVQRCSLSLKQKIEDGVPSHITAQLISNKHSDGDLNVCNQLLQHTKTNTGFNQNYIIFTSDAHGFIL